MNEGSEVALVDSTVTGNLANTGGGIRTTSAAR